MIHRFFSYLFKHQIIFGLFIIATGWLVIQLRDIILSVFVAYIFMSALLPYSKILRKIGMPKSFSVFIPCFIVLVGIFLLVVPLVPFIITQAQAFITKFPNYLNQTAAAMGIDLNIKQAQQFATSQFDTIGRNAFDFTTKIFGGFFSMLTIFIISAYLLYYQNTFNRFISNLFHPDDRPRVITTLDHINDKLGAWLRGQVLLSFSIGVMTWIALTLLNMPFAFPLALIAGLLEVLPTIGPIISAVPAVVVAFTISPTMAITAAVAYIIIQLLENNILVPNIMRRAVGLNPVIVILGIMIGANLMGVAGALLSIPFISFIIVIFQSVDGKD